MAFVSMIFAYLALFAGFLIGLFLIGLVILTVGIILRCLKRNEGRIFPTVIIIVSALFLAPGVVTCETLVISVAKSTITTSIARANYECVPDKWRNENVGDNAAAAEVIEALLQSADAGDREAFAKNFTPNIQSEARFNSDLDKFFESYPVGLSTVELDGGGVSGGASASDGNLEKDGYTHYTCYLDGEWYIIYLNFCHCNDLSPNDVGVTGFYIENVEGNASDIDYSNKALACSVFYENAICARLIDGRGFEFTPYDRQISASEMQALLGKYTDLREIQNEIGPPNVTIKYSNCTGWDHYYELIPEDGEPRYCYLCTQGEWGGEIYYGYLVSDTKTFYDYDMIPGEN